MSRSSTLETSPPQAGKGRPAWAKDAVFYHIFPDRFAPSERVSKPDNLLSWHSAPTEQGYHGGDLLGIVEHLDHLVGLGVNAIYLTPIFQSASNHRYHTHDYYRVDPLLGGNKALAELVDQAHARGIRIILDGVFNHASRGLFQFNDILENGPHSPWLNWFHVDGWPISAYDGRKPANYRGWIGNRALPKFNTDNPQVREFLIGVGEYWIGEYGIDGWRLDVPDQITTPGFWEEFRTRVRAINPEAYLVGEIWHAVPDWLRGNRFDATMNYVFAAAAIAFMGGDRVSAALAAGRSYNPYPGIDATEFGRRIAQLLATYDWETTQVQFNLLDSHDAPRVLSLARGDKATLRLATLFQMTFPGTPSVYYGDEIALAGTRRYDHPYRDQDARRPFPWHDESLWDREMLDFFRRAIALRHAHVALRAGQFHQLYAKDRQYAFLRRHETETLLVVINAADAAAEIDIPVDKHFADGITLRPVFGDSTVDAVFGGRVSVKVPGRWGGVFLG